MLCALGDEPGHSNQNSVETGGGGEGGGLGDQSCPIEALCDPTHPEVSRGPSLFVRNILWKRHTVVNPDLGLCWAYMISLILRCSGSF